MLEPFRSDRWAVDRVIPKKNRLLATRHLGCPLGVLVAIGSTGISLPARSQSLSPPEVRWGNALRTDAKSVHDIIARDHPGVVDELNPAFRRALESGLQEALRKADATTDAGGWWWALREYVARFDDSHLQISISREGPVLPQRWPGFLTGYDGRAHIVRVREPSDEQAPPVGARLVSCDGIPDAELAAKRIGTFFGNWGLEAQRVSYGGWLFRDGSNPWLDSMTACDFALGDTVRTYPLPWRAIEAVELKKQLAAVSARARAFGMEKLPDNSYHIALPSFDGRPNSDAYRALVDLVAQIRMRQDALRQAPSITIDLRGNEGGSSEWGAKIAHILWGNEWLSTHAVAQADAVEWRVSDANIAALQGYLAEYRASGANADESRWASEAIAGLEQAKAQGAPYWREPLPQAPVVAGSARNPVRGRVWILTDAACFSACLDAVDVWKAAGGVQIGRETGADTLYIENKNERLHTGMANLNLSMKVYRGRARGHNEPQRPSIIYDGDIDNDAEVRRWIASLPR